MTSQAVLLVMSVKNLCIQKYVKRKTKASLCRKLFLFFFWPSIYLKPETVHKFIESRKKWINMMHICDYRVGVDISTIHDCMLKFKCNIH